MRIFRTPVLFRLLAAASMAVGLGRSAHATVFSFDSAPFAGTTALTTPGRQIVGNEQFIPTIKLATDVFAFNPGAFGLGSTVVNFANALAANLLAGRMSSS